MSPNNTASMFLKKSAGVFLDRSVGMCQNNSVNRFPDSSALQSRHLMEGNNKASSLI